MWEVNTPWSRATSDALYTDCTSAVRPLERRARLLQERDAVVEAGAAFIDRAANGVAGSPSENAYAPHIATVDDLTALYANRFVKKGSPGRRYYDALKLLAPFSVCPYCGHRDSSVIDHYLPKRRFPLLSIDLSNLVPICQDCNKAKGEATLDDGGFMHPYFDKLDDETWLVARVHRTEPASISYHIEPPDAWPDALRRRANAHFGLLRIGQLYAAQAARELADIRASLESAWSRGQQAEVQYQLGDWAASRRRTLRNNWRAALYACLQGDEWFCSGGFRL